MSRDSFITKVFTIWLRELQKPILKVVSATFLLVYFSCLNEGTCEIRKNVFYFFLKALFVSEKIKV